MKNHLAPEIFAMTKVSHKSLVHKDGRDGDLGGGARIAAGRGNEKQIASAILGRSNGPIDTLSEKKSALKRP